MTEQTAVTLTFEAFDPSPLRGYQLSRNGELVAQLAGTETSFTDRDLTPGTVYEYQLTVADHFGNETTKTLEVMTEKPAVPNPDQQPASITISGDSSVSLGETLQLAALVKNKAGEIIENETVEWKSSDPAIAAVTANGLVETKSAGTVTITAQLGTITASKDITVMKKEELPPSDDRNENNEELPPGKDEEREKNLEELPSGADEDENEDNQSKQRKEQLQQVENDNKGDSLPQTATNFFTYILLGMILIFISVALNAWRRKYQ